MSQPSVSTKPLAALPLPEFLAKLSGSDPTPGGGSVSALAGALGASLVAMVGGLSVGKKGLEDHAETHTLLVEQGRHIAQGLEDAIDRDARAFDAVSAAYRLPKESEADKAARSAAIQEAMKGAAEVPMEVARECLAAAELALVALETGNPNASSDAAVGLLMALAGLEGAMLNVAINLDALKDAEVVAMQRSELALLKHRSDDLRQTMWELARTRIASLPD